jgi:hypothetical protein
MVIVEFALVPDLAEAGAIHPCKTSPLHRLPMLLFQQFAQNTMKIVTLRRNIPATLPIHLSCRPAYYCRRMTGNRRGLAVAFSCHRLIDYGGFSMRLSRVLQFTFSSLLMVSCLAFAGSLDDLSNRDASTGLKAALDKGALSAVSKLGAENGFLSNDKVKIQLPSLLEKARPLLRMAGKEQQLDDLVVSMNHAAEAAVPMAKPLLIDAVKSITISDAKKILTGGDTSVTDFFKEKTSAALGVKFLPIVKNVTDKAGIATRYDEVMQHASRFSNVPDDEKTVEGYVTQRALDGLYTMIAEEEIRIRQDPLGAGSSAIAKVFGLLK